jgi:hypothetical protein
MRTRLPRLLAGLLLVAAAAAAAIVLNVVLLGRAASQNDPAGRLTPHLGSPPAPAWTVRPTSGPVEDQGADD